MQEQNAAIGVAIAGYYPDFTLSGAFGYYGDPFIKQIAGANPAWSYALSIAQPLFNGGLTDELQLRPLSNRALCPRSQAPKASFRRKRKRCTPRLAER